MAGSHHSTMSTYHSHGDCHAYMFTIKDNTNLAGCQSKELRGGTLLCLFHIQHYAKSAQYGTDTGKHSSWKLTGSIAYFNICIQKAMYMSSKR